MALNKHTLSLGAGVWTVHQLLGWNAERLGGGGRTRKETEHSGHKDYSEACGNYL